MKKMQQAEPEFTIDADGQELAHIALANSQHRATLYAEDYRRLIAAGFSRYWKYLQDGRGNVYPTLSAYTCAGHLREVTIARLLANAAHGQRVRAIDGKTLNLRTENLEFVPGPVRFNASDWYPTAAALRAAGFEPATDSRVRSRTQKRPQTSRGNPRGPQVFPCPQQTAERRSIDREALSARVKLLVTTDSQKAP